MSVTIVRTLPEEKWHRFVEEHPAGNVFHTPEMFQVFGRTPGHRPELWAATQDGRVQALLLPVQITLKDGLLRPLTTRAVVYGSVLCGPGPEGEEALRMLLRAYKRGVSKNVLFTELRNVSDLSSLQPVLGENGFAYEEHLNYLIDLEQPEEAIWHKISRTGRQCVRTSRNKGTVIEEVTAQGEMEVVYRLLEGVYTRVQVPLASRTLFEMAFDILGPQGMFKVFMARVGEQYVGALLVLLHKGRLITWYGGSDRAFSQYRPMESLMWHTIKWGKEHGFRVYDFGGAGRPNEDYGPREFKAKFHGTLVRYGRNVCVHAPMRFRLSTRAYAVLRRFL